MLGQTFVVPEMSKFNVCVFACLCMYVCVCGRGGGGGGRGRGATQEARGVEDKGEQEEGDRKGFI